MLITSSIQGRIPVAGEAIVRDPEGVKEFIQGAASKEVIFQAEQIGAFARPESVWVYKAREDEATWQTIFGFFWCPDPTNGVEFHGGPDDGTILSLPRENDGAPRVWHVSAGLPQAWELTTAPLPPAPSPRFNYARRGINSETDRWWYQYMP